MVAIELRPSQVFKHIHLILHYSILYVLAALITLCSCVYCHHLGRFSSLTTFEYLHLSSARHEHEVTFLSSPIHFSA